MAGWRRGALLAAGAASIPSALAIRAWRKRALHTVSTPCADLGADGAAAAAPSAKVVDGSAGAPSAAVGGSAGGTRDALMVAALPSSGVAWALAGAAVLPGVGLGLGAGPA